MIKKLIKIYLIVLLIFIPFQSFVGELLHKNTDLNDSIIFWISHWYEIVLPIFLLLAIINIIKTKIFNKIQILTLFLLILGAISIFFVSPNIKVGLEGFRFTLLPIMLFFAIIAFSYNGEEIKKILKIYLFLSIIIAIFAIFERFLPEFFWVKYHILKEGSGFAAAFKAGSFRQSSSLIGAPNQLASYLLPAFFITLNMIKRSVIPYSLFLILIVAAIILTFSRSALLALAICFLVWATFFAKNRIIVATTWLISLIGVVAIILISKYGGEEIINFISHGTSQSFHLEAMKGFFSEFKDRSVFAMTFGSGLGTAGPAVLKFGNGLIPESWYFQVALELGIFGLILWLLLIIFLLRKLILIDRGLFLGLLAISIVSLFLHTWADNPAIAYTLFILVGINGTKNKKY